MNRMNRITNLNNSFSTHYSGNNNQTAKNNEKKEAYNNMHANSISGNQNNIYKNDYGNYTREKGMHEYKGMDGKIYYTEESLDIANRLYLENQNKGN